MGCPIQLVNSYQYEPAAGVKGRSPLDRVSFLKKELLRVYFSDEP